MSDKISLTVGGKTDAGPSVDNEPISPNARMQWMADLVCAILNAETDRRPMSSSTVKRAPGT
jgi:hypothetical protein